MTHLSISLSIYVYFLIIDSSYLSFFRDRVERVLDLEKEEKQANEGAVRKKSSNKKIEVLRSAETKLLLLLLL